MAESLQIYHPWRHLRDHWPHINVHHTDDLPEDRLGETDGHAKVWLRRRQLQVERRCTLTHELIHLERGDTGECPPAVEVEIDREAARRLIPWGSLLEAARWSRDIEEIADELWVTEKILRARAETLTGSEVLALGEAVRDAHLQAREDT